MDIKNAVETYLTQCKNVKKLEPLTLKAYALDLKQFGDFLGSPCEASSISKAQLSHFIDLLGTQYAARSLKRKVASLKAFFCYLEFEDMIAVSPFRKLKVFIKEPKRVPKSLSLGEMERLFSHLYKNRRRYSSELLDRAVLELLFFTGIRVSELCNIRLQDINLEAQVISVQGKGNRERVVFVSGATLEALRAYLEKRPDSSSGYFFVNRLGEGLSSQSVRGFIRSIGRCVLGKLVTPHMIRHTFATLLLEEGVDITYIKSFLGHSSISTTQIYAASTTAKQRQILTVLHPRNRIRVFV